MIVRRWPPANVQGGVPGRRVGECRRARNPLHTHCTTLLLPGRGCPGPPVPTAVLTDRAESMSDAAEQDREFIERAVSRSEAFLVDADDGTDVGVVDKVRLDHEGRVSRIDVRSGWFGRRLHLFGIDDVVAVFPPERLLVVSSPPWLGPLNRRAVPRKGTRCEPRDCGACAGACLRRNRR